MRTGTVAVTDILGWQRITESSDSSGTPQVSSVTQSAVSVHLSRDTGGTDVALNKELEQN